MKSNFNFYKRSINKLLILGLFVSIYHIGSTLSTSASASANDDLSSSTVQNQLVGEVSDTIHSTALDVEGSYQSEDPAKPRRDLERNNNDLAFKKLEDLRISEEKKITKKINNMFDNNKNKNQNQNLEDEGKEDAQTPAPVIPTVVKAAEVKEAPVKILDENANTKAPVVTAKVEEVDKDKEVKKIKIIPSVSGIVYKGEYESYQANLSPGLALEFPLSEQIGLSFGLNYNKIDITDVSRNDYNWYYTWAFNNFGYNNLSREIEGSGISLEVTPKLYLTKNNMINPYIGLGVGYDYLNMKYTSKDQSTAYSTYYANYAKNFGDEEYTSSYISGKVVVGAEMSFTKNIGMNIECKYSKGVTELSKQNEEYIAPGHYNKDQRLLQLLGEDINTANKLSLGAGLVILF